MKKVLIIGAGSYQVPLILRLNELGHQTYCVDANPLAMGFKFSYEHRIIDVCDKDKCLAYAKEIGIDAIMTYGATITLPTVAYIGNALHLPALGEQTAEISKNKYSLKKQLADSGLNIYGDFFCIKSPQEIKQRTFSLPCVVKPCDGSGSKGVTIVTNEKNINTALDYSFKNARFGEVYIESFIAGEEYSVEVFSGNGKQYVYAIVKTTFYKDADGQLHYGHRTPSGLPADIEASVKFEALKATKVLDVNMGSVNFDIIVSDADKKPYIIDVGIRIGQNLIASHLVPLSRGISELDCLINLALQNTVDIEPQKNNCIATRLLIYTPGIIQKIKDYSSLIGNHGIVDIIFRKKEGDMLPPYKEKSDSCGWVITSGSTPEEAEKNADLALKVLKNYIIIDEKQEQS